jgi:hypothetical protein
VYALNAQKTFDWDTSRGLVGYPRGKEGADNYRVPVRHKEGKQGGKENVLMRVLPPKSLTLLTNDYQGVIKIPLYQDLAGETSGHSSAPNRNGCHPLRRERLGNTSPTM